MLHAVLMCARFRSTKALPTQEWGRRSLTVVCFAPAALRVWEDRGSHDVTAVLNEYAAGFGPY
jgi:hypothetical protein